MSSIADVLSVESIDRLVLRVQAAIHTSVAPLTITLWRTREPVPYARRESGERLEGRVGEPWASHLFDCAWMRFRAEVPAGSAPEALVARIDINGELLLVDVEGAPVRGLTCVKSTFDSKLGGPGKTIYRLPPEAVKDGVVEFWGDAGLNDLFGFVKDGGRVALAEIALVREDVRQLYYDLETLRDYLLTLPGGGAGAPKARPAWGAAPDPGSLARVAAKLREDLSAVAAELDLSNAAGVARGRERLAPWFSEKNGKPALIVHAIGHAHLDLAWLWPIRETIRKGARTFASALYNIERYPEYVFGCSQPQLFAWMKEFHPGLYSRIKDAVRAGRIEPQGTFWVEPDCNMPSGEAFVRQILHGAKFFREEFGVVPDYCWEPDVFGYHGQLPQILKKSGHDYFMTQKLSWNVVNRFGHHSFHWEGIDGTRILTHMLPEETYNGPAAARSLRRIADDYLEKDVSNHALMAFGIGDGGGGPDAEHLERLRRAPRLPGLPAVRLEKAGAFFETWSRDADKFPVWQGELYLERHQGTLTTQALVKRNNRRAEIALRELEWAAFLAGREAGVPYPAEALDRLWKEVLLYQFHDVLPGSSIKRVYDECNARYAAILAELAELTRERYAAAAARIAPAGGRVVFNSLSWPRKEWLRLDGAWQRAEVPALGWAIAGGRRPPGAVCNEGQPGSGVEPTAPGGRRPPVSAGESLLENENLRVTFAADGRIASLFDKRARREVLAPGEYGNDFVVLPDTGDAWDFETDHDKKDVWGYLRGAVERPVLRETCAGIDGPCASVAQVWIFRSSEIRQTIRLFAGAEQLEFDTEADWREPATMLRVRFPAAVRAEEARFEIPFGHIRRTTREDTPRQRAQIEVAALQWIDLSEEDYGVALYNDCKHGFRVKGHVLDMAVLRSVPHPGAALIDRNDKADSTGAVYTDLERHVFRYALRPHAGPADAAALTAEARAFNTPLVPMQVAGVVAQAESAARGAFVETGAAEIELAALKRAEDGRGWVLRLVNVTGRAVATTLCVRGQRSGWRECDLMERPLPDASPGGRAEVLSFTGFEIKTVRQEL